LLWGIACVGSDDSDSGDVEALVGSPSADSGAAAVPSAFYALIKLCHHGATAGEQRIPLVPAIAHRAMNGDGKGASELASRRLTASGCSPLVKLLPVSGEVARRTVAAMLFPISPRDFRILKHSITHKPKDQTV
jgi:CRISPR-associated protein Csx17